MKIAERVTAALIAAQYKPRRVFLDGYIACFFATLVFAISLFDCYSYVQVRMEATQAILGAIYVASATVLVSITVMFEFAEKLRNRVAVPLSLSIVVGMVALAPIMGVLRLHPLIPKVAILLASLHVIRLVAREAGWRRAVAPILGGAVIGYWMFLLSFVDGYKTPWIAEATMFGQVHVDLLFHSAIVNMLRSFGVGSIGVDGATPFPYYFGSHRIIGALSGILDVQPLTFYSVVFPVLLGPLFLALFFFFAASFQAFLLNRECSGHDKPGTRNGLFWLLSAIVFVGVFPAEFRRFLGLFDNVFHSESFGIGMLFAYVPGVFFFEYISQKQPMRLTVAWLALGGAYLAGLCMVKLSVACVIAGTAAYLLLRLKLSWLSRMSGLLTIAAPLCYGVWITRGGPSGDSGPKLVEMIKPFAFLRDTVDPGFWLLSFIAFFGPFILFVWMRALLHPMSLLNTLKADVAALNLVDVEALTALLIVSVVPGMVLSIPQGATNFFSEVSYWFVLPMLAVTLFERAKNYYLVEIACPTPVVHTEFPNG